MAFCRTQNNQRPSEKAVSDGFANAVLQRSKTDKQDAKLIARYCKAMNPEAWQPQPSEQRHLQELTRYLSRLKRLRAAEQNKRQTAPRLPERPYTAND
ncbi:MULTISPECIES: transposase [unclassified Neisseria]|uniref:IS110 family transposase n=1 Tax=unclassified Neisseria TaxID=2623750 RepID=UPI001071D3B4|nr:MULTISPECIES: transposase [unclassified Neisseria]MBF0803062.1 transposase [Neisseria sp. 19428wB4_WF04]TFU44353.1 hypothetical protein E4T99_01595 [Neisseria sp. WF04]